MSLDKPAARVIVCPLLEIAPVWVIAPLVVRLTAPPELKEAISRAPAVFSKVIESETALAVSDVPDGAAEFDEIVPVLAVRSNVPTVPNSIG